MKRASGKSRGLLERVRGIVDRWSYRPERHYMRDPDTSLDKTDNVQ